VASLFKPKTEEEARAAGSEELRRRMGGAKWWEQGGSPAWVAARLRGAHADTILGDRTVRRGLDDEDEKKGRE
jgi:hypothetical protein